MTVDLVRVAAVQATPVFLDQEATTNKACELIARAAEAGAGLVVFPESFIPTYPDWIWRRRPWDDGEARWFTRFTEEAVEVPGPTIDRLAEAAGIHGVYVTMGITERAAESHTLYNSIVFLGPDADVLGVHRKLMPTGAERLVWGQGDGSSLRTYETPFGRLGGLICWENYMPFARAALYAQGVDILVAPTWDNDDVWVPSMRHIAKEGRIYVVSVSPVLRGTDVPSEIPGRDEIYGGEDDWMSKGNGVVVDPYGRVLAGPMVGEEGIVYADVDPRRLAKARQRFDPVGHYSRPDVFTLRVHPIGRSPVVVEDSSAPTLHHEPG